MRLIMSGWSRDSRIRRRYVSTATEEPPSISDDSRSEGYLHSAVSSVEAKKQIRRGRTKPGIQYYIQQLLEENDLKMFQQCRLDLH